MENKSNLPDNRSSLQVLKIYTILALTITLVIYYLPNYFVLERIIADHSTTILRFGGLDVQLNVYGEKTQYRHLTLLYVEIEEIDKPKRMKL